FEKMPNKITEYSVNESKCTILTYLFMLIHFFSFIYLVKRYYATNWDRNILIMSL
uniref:Protein wntless n=1 Tax=Strongyloides venezuelensis TaxID=75913 RepID=A0A0K0FWF9_STRVS